MSAAAERPARAPQGLRALWAARPAIYSPPLWALVLALDALPWPLGEDLLAGMFGAVALVRPSRRRPAFRWAARQPGGRSPWRLALAGCAFRGRWVARSALVGVRSPDDLRRRIAVRGAEHLAAAPAGAILLGFHLGPPGADVALRSAGHRLAWLGGRRTSRAWSRPAWQPLLEPGENLAPPAGEWFWPGLLYRARGLLRGGGRIFVIADALAGRELFRLPLPGSELTIRSGWLMLHQQTGAPVLPTLTHLEGRRQVVTIHPPLPPLGAAPGAEGLRAWASILGALVRDHVARFPEQCPVLMFPPRLYARRARDVRPRSGPGAAVPQAR